jgi:hypothetical protein
MIIVADFYRIGNEHVPVNAGLLYMISKEYEQMSVSFFGDQKHINAIRAFWAENDMNVNNVVFREHTGSSENNRGIRMVLSRILFEVNALRKLSAKLKTEKNVTVFFLSISSVAAIFQKRFFFQEARVINTMHGDVEFTRLNNDFTRNFLGRCLRQAFKMKRQRVKYLVLDEVIKNNLIKEKFLLHDEIISIQHPYIFKNDVQSIEYAEPYKIGHIGVASNEKQSFYLFQLAERFREFVQKKRLSFFLIGRNENIKASSANELIVGANNNCMLERNEFEGRIKDIHYAIFFYNDIYQLTGSGAVLDAFNFEKPIIALKNELFDSIFKRAGNIGFLCGNVSEIESLISDIVAGKISKTVYNRMGDNMRKFKKDHSINKLQDQLFSQLYSLFNEVRPAAYKELV